MTRNFSAAALIVLLFAACSADDVATEQLQPGECAAPLVADAVPGKFTVGPDGRLHDSAGRDVVLRGVNAGGRSKWAPYFPFPVTGDESATAFAAKADTFFRKLRGWGLDAVRLTFSWQALEPQKGAYDEQYLNRYVAMVDACRKLNLRVIVDFHQDVYAEPFCGDGFPLWTLQAADRSATCGDPKSWFAGYLQVPIIETYKRFFANTDGVLDSFKAMWAKMAGRLKDHPAVVGFEIINEPGGWEIAGLDVWKTDTLNPFHEVMVAELRKVAPNKLVFFDNPGIDAVGIVDVTHVRPKGDNLVYAPHYYDQALLLGGKAGNADVAKDLQKVAAFAGKSGLHTLLGEFGFGHGSTGGAQWLAKVMSFVDSARWSATLWEYSQNESLWNEEDLSIVTATGDERPILDTYVRPWLRAVAGSSANFNWDTATGIAQAQWASTGGVSELVVPARLMPAGPKNIKVTGGCWRWDADRGLLGIKAEPNVDVTVTFNK